MPTFAGRYITREPLGQGNFSTVSVADVSEDFRKGDQTIPATVAIKWVPKNDTKKLVTLKKEWDVFAAMLQEVTGSLSAPQPNEGPKFIDTADFNIVGAYEWVEDEEHAAIVLEHCDCDLMEFIQKSQLAITERVACSIMKQLLTAIDYTHQLGFVHRDIKPHNLLVSRPLGSIIEGQDPLTSGIVRLRLADFGLAKSVGKSNLWARQNSAGDYDFMPPEVQDSVKDGSPMRRGEYHRSDSFAAGLCMMYLLTGDLDKVVRERLCTTTSCASLDPAFRQKYLGRFSDDCVDVLLQLLNQFPSDRVLPSEALAHKWFDVTHSQMPSPMPTAGSEDLTIPAPAQTIDNESAPPLALPQESFMFRDDFGGETADAVAVEEAQ